MGRNGQRGDCLLVERSFVEEEEEEDMFAMDNEVRRGRFIIPCRSRLKMNRICLPCA